MRSICVGCDQFVLAADGWSKEMKTSALTNLQFSSGTCDSISSLEKKIKMFNDGTNPTAGIDKGYHNRFTAILNFPKIKVVLNLL